MFGWLSPRQQEQIDADNLGAEHTAMLEQFVAHLQLAQQAAQPILEHPSAADIANVLALCEQWGRDVMNDPNC